MDEKKERTITFKLNYDEWFAMAFAVKYCKYIFNWQGDHFLTKGSDSLLKKLDETRFDK